jgi:preprotein translocase subunit SecA
MHSDSLVEEVHGWLHEDLDEIIESGQWESVAAFLREIDPKSELRPTTRAAAHEALDETLSAAVARTKTARGEDAGAFHQYVRGMFLYTLDQLWMEYVDNKDEVRRAAALEGYGAIDPFVAFVRRSAGDFNAALEMIRSEIASRYRFHLATQGPRT